MRDLIYFNVHRWCQIFKEKFGTRITNLITHYWFLYYSYFSTKFFVFVFQWKKTLKPSLKTRCNDCLDWKIACLRHYCILLCRLYFFVSKILGFTYICVVYSCMYVESKNSILRIYKSPLNLLNFSMKNCNSKDEKKILIAWSCWMMRLDGKMKYGKVY